MKKIFFLILINFLFFNSPIFAQDSVNTGAGGTITLNNPLGTSISTPQAFIGQLINGLLGIVGSIALAMFVWGGFKWMTSAGNSKKVDEGKETMVWATLGLIIIFSSYALVKFVIEKVAVGQ